jgi:hypothetical protein
MKTKLTALALAAATAFTFAPKPAAASDKGLAVVGGLIGGLIIGSAIADHDNDRVVVSAGYDRHDNHGSRYDRRDSGYWKTVSVNVWVPGYWVSDRYHGRTIRRFVAGHHERRIDRVWVANNRHDRYDRRDGHRDDRGHGYDNDRRDRDYRR